MTRIPYTPDTRYGPAFMPIRDCCNASHIDAYLCAETYGYPRETRLIALQVMRDHGLLPETHRQIAVMRREYTRLRLEQQRLFALACQDYAGYWDAYRGVKWRGQELKREAEDLYNAMFFTPAWQAWKHQHEPLRQLALFEGQP